MIFLCLTSFFSLSLGLQQIKYTEFKRHRLLLRWDLQLSRGDYRPDQRRRIQAQ